MSARVPCPVLTCRRDMAADMLMCTTCWAGLPAYQRVAVEAASKAVRRQPHHRNAMRLETAIATARRMAQTVSS